MKSLVLKYQYFANLLEGQYFFEILHTLSPVITSNGEYFFGEMKERYKVSCVNFFFRNSLFN